MEQVLINVTDDRRFNNESNEEGNDTRGRGGNEQQVEGVH
jgi:hypothetical protein